MTDFPNMNTFGSETPEQFEARTSTRPVRVWMGAGASEPPVIAGADHQMTRTHGGRVSLQFGVDDPGLVPGAPEPNMGLRVRTGSGVVRYSGETGEVTVSRRTTSFDTAELGNGLEGALSTVKTSSGFPVLPHDIKPDHLITVEGYTTTVEVAERMGLITRNAAGQYAEREAPATGPEGGEGQQADQGDTTTEAFAAPVEQALARIAEASTADTQIAVVDQIARTGEASPALIGRLATELGIEPQEAARVIEGVSEEFRGQAKATLRGLGVNDFDTFSQWASDHRAEALERAIFQHATERTTRGYAPLVSEFLASYAEHDPEAVLSAECGRGIATVMGPDGRPAVSIDGRVMGFEAAVKAGLIRVNVK